MAEKKEEKDFRPARFSWYPGHMAKTKRQIIETMNIIDVVIELLDSRIPISSRNPDIQAMTKNKKKIIILNKADLADDIETAKWKNYFTNQADACIITDSSSGKGIDKVTKKIDEIMKEEKEKAAARGRINKTIRCMILGIPNVGKSSFINRIVKTNRLEVGNKPGVTRKKQWISINDKINLLDTPGVLWPRFEDENTALNLAFTGTIKDDVLEQTEIAYQLLKFLLENYRQNVTERYKITLDFIEKKLSQDQPENFNVYEIMQEIGRKRGAIISGGEIDDEKTAKIILDDFRSGRLGKITIEKAK